MDHSAATKKYVVSRDPTRVVDVITMSINSKAYYVVVPGNRMTFVNSNIAMVVNERGQVRAQTSFPTHELSLPTWVFEKFESEPFPNNIQLYGETPFVTDTRSTGAGRPKTKSFEIRPPKGLNLQKYSRLMLGDSCIGLIGRYENPLEKHVSKSTVTSVGFVFFHFDLHFLLLGGFSGSGVYCSTKTIKGGLSNQHVTTSYSFKAYRDTVSGHETLDDDFLLGEYLKLGEFMRQSFEFVWFIFFSF